MGTETPSSPKWSTASKVIVLLTGMVLVGSLLDRFSDIIHLLVLAFIVALLVVPIVRVLNDCAGI